MSFAISTVFKAVDKFTRPLRRFQKSILRYTGTVERQLKRINKMTGFVADKMMKLGKNTALAGAVGAVGFGLYVNSANAAVAETEALAKSVMVSSDTINAYSAAVKGAGFQTDNIVDLIEEMNNKLGESAGLETITPVNESLELLGLNFEKIRKLKPEDQFKQITNAALKMADGQKAAAALDILMGGEANKIIGVLRNKVSSIDELTKNYDKLNFMTDEARKGAIVYTDAMNDLGTAVSTFGQLVSGIVGESLTPLIKELTAWAAANKALIQKNVTDWIRETVATVKALIPELKTGASMVLEWVGGLQTLKESAVIFFDMVPWIMGAIAALKLAEVAMIAFNFIVAANPIGLMATAISLLIVGLIAMAMNWDKVMASMRDADGIFGAILTPVRGVLEVVDLLIVSLTRLFALGNRTATFAETFKPLMETLSGVGQFMGLSQDTSSQPLRRSDFQAPPDQGERLADSIREERSTSTSEVVIRDETGRAAPKGRLAPGVRFASSEPLG